jgi:hypothetical protein
MKKTRQVNYVEKAICRALSLFLQTDLEGIVIKIDEGKFVVFRAEGNQIKVSPVPDFFDGCNLDEGMKLSLAPNVNTVKDKYIKKENK